MCEKRGVISILCKNADCKICFDKSFASSKESKFMIDNSDPRQIFKNSHTKFKFKCPVCDYEFMKTPHDIADGYFCSHCLGSILCGDESCMKCKEKSVASCDPIILKRWYNDTNPLQVLKTTEKKYKFKCEKCLHVFESSICAMVHSTNKCIYCANQKLCGEESCNVCYAKSIASIKSPKVKCWLSEENDLQPYQVFKKCDKKYWFQCDTCNHKFQSSPNSVFGVGQHWCPYCADMLACEDPDCEMCKDKPEKLRAKNHIVEEKCKFKGTRVRLCKVESCEVCKNRSFASHEKSKYWHDDNLPVTPRDVPKQSSKKFYFLCDKCKHKFQMSLSGIVSKNAWCQYCSNTFLCDDPKCEMCTDKSAVSCGEEIISKWSPKNKLTPRQVGRYSEKKIIFACKCGHEMESTVYNMVNSITKCNYCAGKSICGKEDCTSCYENSFASFDKEKVVCWSKKNKLKPIELLKGSMKKYIFDCKVCGHEFESSLAQVSHLNNWCPYCGHKNYVMMKLVNFATKIHLPRMRNVNILMTPMEFHQGTYLNSRNKKNILSIVKKDILSKRH